MFKEHRNTGYIRINNERELLDLIPGDWIYVWNDDKSNWMVCQELCHGVGNGGPRRDVNPQSMIAFIEVPRGYCGIDNVPFVLWKSYIEQIQFSEDGVHLNKDHTQIIQIAPESEKHASLKNLVDKGFEGK